MSSAPDLSVIIPVFNRGELLRHTLHSVQAASGGLKVQIVAVDDGSHVPLAEDLARQGLHVDKLLRQENRGLLYARLAGLDAADGRNLLFLDSDDFVSAETLSAHVSTLDAGADVSYTDFAQLDVDPIRGPADAPGHRATLSTTTDPAELFITLQPPPHSPAFRADYLRARVAQAPFPPSPLYNPVAEIWFYHVCAPFPARVAKCPGLAIVGRHPGARLTNHWEKLGVAALAVQEAFLRSVPATAEGRKAARLVAGKAFDAWRRLPLDMPADFDERMLQLWSHTPGRPGPAELGGPFFTLLARGLGPIRAGRLLRKLRNGPYQACRTINDRELRALIDRIPQPSRP